MRYLRYTFLSVVVVATLCVSKTVGAATYRIPVDTLWTMPRAAVELHPDGSVGLVKIRRNINAALDAEQFKSYSYEKKKYIPGGVKAWSNPADAKNVIDGRTDTWWSPRAGDPLEQWMIELDLGRAVAVKKIRLVFAGVLGVKPFERFSVYISEGARIMAGKDMVRYRLLGRQTLPNRERVVEYPVAFTEVMDTTRTGLKVQRSLDFDLVRYVRVVLDAESENPALAELEVEAIGDNIALETLRNGGLIDARYSAMKGPNLFDGDAGTYWNFPPVNDAEWDKEPGRPGGGAWFEWDLGAAFWIDQFFLSFGTKGRYGSITVGGGEIYAVPGYLIFTSDGSPRPGGALEGVPAGRFDYHLLADVENLQLPYQFHFNHIVEPRKVRYIFFRVAHGWGHYGRGSIPLFEFQLFGEGYPAEATLISPPLSIAKLTGRRGAKLATAFRWEAEQDFPATRVEIQTRTGDTVDTLRTYYRHDGKEVSKEKYYKLPTKLRGKIKESFIPGEGWSDWSPVYAQPEGSFLSPSPSLFVQFQIKLISEQRELAPILRGLSIDLVEPLVGSITGAVQPREVEEVDRPQRYLYQIWPAAKARDRGFDQVLIKAPLVKESVLLKIGGKDVEPDSVEFRSDSLFVWLPQRVTGDSLAVEFTARVSRNGVQFGAWVGNSSLPGIWQEVDPVTREAVTIFLPVLAEEEALIGNLQISPRIFTPNGDGANDQTQISFSLFKVEGKVPAVTIYNLNGELVKKLVRLPGQGERYLWDGHAESGQLVSPGTYLCRIQVEADKGMYSVERTINVVY